MLEKWLKESEEHQKIKEELTLSLDLLEDYAPTFPIDVEKDYLEMRKQMEIPKNSSESKVVNISSRRRWLSIAAAIGLLIAAVFLLRTPQTTSEEWVLIDTTNQEMQEIALSDGSMVWLNTNSQLKYPKVFAKNSRAIQLTGEAFFDVHKNPNKPFQIETARSKVEVLGTSFNVRAYTNEDSTAVFVQTGKVKFSKKQGTSSTLLTANQSATFNHRTQKLATHKTADSNVLAWKSKQLQFKSTSLSTIFSTLEKHFKVTIIAENPAFKKCTHSMTPQEVSLDKILTSLEKIYGLEIKKESPTRYIVKGDGC